MTPHQLADQLSRDQRRVLLRLRQHRGTISGARAFELQISRDQVATLAQLGLVQVSNVTGDLELTPDGDDMLQLFDPLPDPVPMPTETNR